MNLSSGLEIWGGIECTINRVGDAYMDQLEFAGHYQRTGDIDAVAGLGVRRLRYPVLWERHANPEVPERFRFAACGLERLRAHDIVPIVGLVHHGSGPPTTNLLDPLFPLKLANYASEVAREFPWVTAYTPVNEPLTTARFSGLYGHWYPHASDPVSFATALLHQCRAVALAMAAIRRVNPQAQLVLTDDLGHVRSVPSLRYQADFENERRWLAYDLLFGRVKAGHPMWDLLRQAADGDRLLGLMQDQPCPPNILGFNYYVTSERFLDDRLDRYSPALYGGNGRDTYVDVEAVRVCPDGLLGARELLNQAWRRFQAPLALTEVHLGCTEDEQMRWLRDVYQGAVRARADGANVIGLTVWALFGSYDWHTLVTRREGKYEPGVFEISHGALKARALTAYVQALARGEKADHPRARGPGWWETDERFN